MSLALGSTIIATNTRCKYDADAISSLSKKLSTLVNQTSSFGRLSALDSLSSISAIANNLSNSISSISSQIDGLSTCIQNISVDLMNAITDGQFMDMNFVQTFTYISTGPVIYENTVDGWYYSEGLGGNYIIIGNPEDTYVVNAYPASLPRIHFVDRTFTPVKANTKICFARLSDGRLNKDPGKLTLATLSTFQFIPARSSFTETTNHTTVTTDLKRGGSTGASGIRKIELSASEWSMYSPSAMYVLTFPITIKRISSSSTTRLGDIYVNIAMKYKSGSFRSIKTQTPLEKDVMEKTYNIKLVIQPKSISDADRKSLIAEISFGHHIYGKDGLGNLIYSSKQYSTAITDAVISDSMLIEPLKLGKIDISCAYIDNVVNVYQFDPTQT